MRVSKQLANGSETPDFSAGCRFRSGSLENSNKTAKTRFQCRLRARSGSLDAEKTICQGRLTVSTRFETEKRRPGGSLEKSNKGHACSGSCTSVRTSELATVSSEVAVFPKLRNVICCCVYALATFVCNYESPRLLTAELYCRFPHMNLYIFGKALIRRVQRKCKEKARY